MNYIIPRRLNETGPRWPRAGFNAVFLLLIRFVLIRFLLIGFFFSAKLLQAQAFHIPEHSINIVNGCARLQPDLFAAVGNPAVFGTVRTTRLAASGENAWSLPELNFSRAMVVLPAGNGAIGLGIQQSGNTDYRESGYSFGYGLTLGKASMGLLLNYQRFRAAGYQALSSGAGVFGLRIPLFPDLLTGISFSVPFTVSRGENHTDKPAGDYRIEMGFLASAQVSLFAAWAKTDGLSAAAEIGLDYAFADHFFFVAGLHGRTGAPFGKAGWAKNGWRLVLFTAYQAPLGFSPGLGLSWDRPEKKNGSGMKGGEKKERP